MTGFFRKILRGESPAFAVLLTFVTQGLVVILNTGTGVITARVLGPHGRGVFTAATIWPQFLSGIAAFGVPTSVVYYIRSQRADRERIIAASYVLTMSTCTAAMLAGLVAVPLAMQDDSRQAVWLAEFCILWTWLNMLTVMVRQIMVACDMFRAFSISSYLPPLSYLILLLLAWPTIGLDPVTAACCLMLSGLPGLLWMINVVQSTARSQFSGCAPWLWRMVGYSARFAASDTASGLLAYIDRLMLIPILPAAELGLYVVAYSLSRLMFVLQTAVGSVLYASMAGRDPTGTKYLHDIAFRLTFYAVGLVIVCISLISHSAITLVYGQAYADAAGLLRILVIEAGVTCVGQVNVQLYLSLNRPGFPAIAQVVNLVVAVGLIAVLVPRDGAAGAAMALVLASLTRSALLFSGIPAFLRLPIPSLLPKVEDLGYIRARLG